MGIGECRVGATTTNPSPKPKTPNTKPPKTPNPKPPSPNPQKNNGIIIKYNNIIK